MKDPGNQRVEAVKAFYRSGASVCLRARSDVDKAGFASVREHYSPRNVAYPLLGLVKGTDLMSATYVFETDRGTHEIRGSLRPPYNPPGTPPLLVKPSTWSGLPYLGRLCEGCEFFLSIINHSYSMMSFLISNVCC